jgi:hypothetical protein
MDTLNNHHVFVQPARTLASLSADHEAQVFVDHSGRRARCVRLVGAGMAGLCCLWLTGLVIGMAGFANFPTVRSPFRLLPALARVDATRATARRMQARELVSDRSPIVSVRSPIVSVRSPRLARES